MIKNIVLVHGAWADGSGWESVHNILTEKGFNVTAVLVGHSYGGAVISEAGESLFKMLSSAPQDPNSPILPPADGFIWLDWAKFHTNFCPDVPAAKARFMADSQVPAGLAAFSSDLTTAAWKAKKSWYIVATEDKMIPPDVERGMAKRANAEVTEIKASHAVYISHAAEVAKVIEQAAASA